MILFGVQLGWLPISGIRSLNYEYLPPGMAFWDLIRHLILPVSLSAFGGLAGLSRYMRANMLEVIRQDYILTARAKGLSERAVIYRHALRNALLPVITILGLSVPGLIGGSVIFETIFAIPGMGQLFYMAVMARDYPVVMGILFIGAVLTLLGNLLADRLLCRGRSADPGLLREMTMGKEFRKRFRKNRLAVAGGAIVLLLFAVSLLAPWLAPYDPNAIDLKNVLAPPSGGHLFGTDPLGRDVCSRMIWGAGISLKVGFVATGIAILIGTILGALAGYYGRWVDAVIMRFVDIMLCFPTFFLILAVIAILEPSIWNIMIVIGLTGWMGVTRLVRADFISLKERDFVQAARGIGAGRPPDHLPPHPPERDGVGPGDGDPRRGGGDPHGIGPELPRHRGPAAHAELGEHPDGGEGQYRHRLVALPLPGACHPDHRARLQSAGGGDPRRP